MRFRGLLIAVATLALLAGAVYWSNRSEKAKAGKPAPDAPPQILSIAADQIQRMEIRGAASEPVVLQKNAGGTWEMATAPKWPVDQDAANAIVSTLSSLASERLVEEKAADLGQFGLASPAVEITAGLKDGKSRKLLIGDDSPAGGGSFVKLDGDSRVFTIAAYNKAALNKTPRDLRDKRLMVFDAEKLARVELTAKGQTVEFGKNSLNEWQIIKPQPLRADGSQVDDLVRALADARMEPSTSDEDDKKNAAAFAGATLVAIARVTDASGTKQLEIRRDKDKNCFARASAVEGVFKVASELGSGLDKGLADFRNKKLFDFGFSDPGKVEIRDGAKQAAYQKLPDKWMSGPTQVDATTVNNLIDKLRDLTATGFVERALPAPVFEATVTSENGKRVEKVLIAREGTNCFAKRENEPVIYELDGKAVEELQKAASDVKAYQLPKPEAKKK
jgi:hypothetical protein